MPDTQKINEIAMTKTGSPFPTLGLHDIMMFSFFSQG
jgi:hypothetical protein